MSIQFGLHNMVRETEFAEIFVQSIDSLSGERERHFKLIYRQAKHELQGYVAM